MPRVLVATLPEDTTAAGEIYNEMSQHVETIGYITDEPATVTRGVATAGAMIIVIGAEWSSRITNHEVLYDAIATALNRRDMLVSVALVDEAAAPTLDDLPEPLHALAYMRATEIDRTGGRFAVNVRQMAVPVQHHLKRLEQSGRLGKTEDEVAAARRARRNRGLPWNIIIIATALITGIVFILLPNQHEDDETIIATPPRSAAANAAIINTSDGLLLGIGTGLSSDTAPQGESLVNGVRLALIDRPEVNVEGVAFPVELVVQDAGCSSQGGLQAAETFVSDDALAAVIGHLCNSSCFAATSIYDENEMTVVSPACDATGLTLNENTSFNRTVPAIDAGVADVIQFVQTTLDYDRVAVIKDEEVLGGQLADTFEAAYTTTEGEIAGVFRADSPTLEIDELAAEIRAVEPELIYFGGRAPIAAQVAAALPEVPLMLARTVVLEEFLAESPLDERSAPVYTYELLPLEDALLESITERYVANFEAEPASPVFAYAYDATNMVLDGIEAVGEVDVIGNLLVDRVALQAYIRQYDGAGVTGPLVCTGTGNCALAEVRVLPVEE
jgi:branched-chain amino acid transport system substrate-binding protein